MERGGRTGVGSQQANGRAIELNRERNTLKKLDCEVFNSVLFDLLQRIEVKDSAFVATLRM